VLILKTRARGGFTGDSSGKMQFDPRRLCSSRLLWLSAMAHRYVCPLRGKATADGEPASVTDEKPAHDSAGHFDPVD
jgi:hypothetical protein